VGHIVWSFHASCLLRRFACFTALSTPVASSPSTGDVSLHCLPQNILLAWYFEELAFVEA
jgi:hypothetical protein